MVGRSGHYGPTDEPPSHRGTLTKIMGAVGRREPFGPRYSAEGLRLKLGEMHACATFQVGAGSLRFAGEGTPNISVREELPLVASHMDPKDGEH